MATPDRHVVGLDLSKTSVKRSTEVCGLRFSQFECLESLLKKLMCESQMQMFSSLPNSKHFSFLEENFFTWEPTEKFDLIFDYKYTHLNSFYKVICLDFLVHMKRTTNSI